MQPARVIALFGGSFNPPHLAHQMMCLVALETEPIDEVWMAPTFRHAFGKALAPFDDRVEMCRLAARPFGARVVVSTIEGELAAAPGAAESRTFHTVTALTARHPDVSFRLLIGEDILAEKAGWYRWDDLVALAPPIVVGRDGEQGGVGFKLPDISSTDVRARLARGDSVLPLVSRPVLDYIAGRGLYR